MLNTSRISNQSRKADSLSLELVNSKTEIVSFEPIWHLQVPNCNNFPIKDFLRIGFTFHRIIFEKVKEKDARVFYISRCTSEHYTVEELIDSIERDDYRHQGNLPNNFSKTHSKRLVPTSVTYFVELCLYFE